MPVPFTQSFDIDAISTTFDDSLYQQFDNFVEQAPDNSESTTLDKHNLKLLGFGCTIHKTLVLDQAGQTWPRMSAELSGTFCVAEDVFEGDTSGKPLELTCYRRNNFQIAGTITLSRTVGHVLLDQCRRAAIYDLMATLSATESIEGKSTEIINMPKSGGPSGIHEEKTGTSPPAEIPIDLTSNQQSDSMFVSIPIAWERLQFKFATANNGKRKGLQQHYRIQISLTAKVDGDRQRIKLAEIQSNPIVVRGRNPKNFDSSRDVPLGERRIESVNHMKISDIATTPPRTTSPEHRSKKTNTHQNSLRHRLQIPQIPQTRWTVESQDTNLTPSGPSLDLSLAVDDLQHHRDTDSYASKNQGSKNSMTSPMESIDHLYEYFPLSVDDWMLPVDAIYRPHVVHHLGVTLDLKARQTRVKPKRYFSAED